MRIATLLFAVLSILSVSSCIGRECYSFSDIEYFASPPDSLDELQIEITSVDSMRLAVFHQRIYEIVVTPYDRYMNIIDEPVEVTLSARFQNEFRFDEPGCTDIFSLPQTLHGETAFYVISTVDRQLGENEPQLLTVNSVLKPHVMGFSNYYEVRRHPPSSFMLLNPANNTLLLLQSATTSQSFEWQPSIDPVRYSKISRYSNAFLFDSIRYTISFTDSASLAHTVRMPSDQRGISPKFSTTHGELSDILDHIFGRTWLTATTIWFIEATDGITTTSNTVSDTIQQYPGFFLRFILGATPHVEQLTSRVSSFLLHQNYPNPFNPSTTIRFEIIERGHVTLRVYDLLGNQVAELANETLDPGVYSTEFNASGLASGVYTYILQTGTSTLTKRMIVEK